MCRVLGVSTSGCYAWLARSASRRAREDAALKERNKKIHKAPKETYGAPRIHAELASKGVTLGSKRVARLMREAGLEGVSRRKGPPVPRGEKQRVAL